MTGERIHTKLNTAATADRQLGVRQQVSPLVSLEKANIFQVSLAGATVIIVYLFREVRFGIGLPRTSQYHSRSSCQCCVSGKTIGYAGLLVSRHFHMWDFLDFRFCRRNSITLLPASCNLSQGGAREVSLDHHLVITTKR